MRSFLLISALLAIGQCSVLLDYSLPNEIVQLMGFREQRVALSPCQDIQFNYCQTQFNSFFGLDNSVTWRNGTLVFQTVSKFLEMNVTEIVKVCNTRTQFYQCLGTSYYSCLSLYSILNRPNPDFQQAFDYVRTFRSLEYMCVGGFPEVVGQWDCIGTFPTTAAYQNCMAVFNNTLTANNFCPSVDITGACLNDAYTAACGQPGAGYFGCENFRITFDNACWGLRCAVNN